MPKKAATKKTTRRTTSRAKRPKKVLQFLQKPDCQTCRKARRFLEKRGYKLNYRDIVKHPLAAAELEKLVGKHDHEDFLRPSSSLFQKLKMKVHPPSRREAIRMMARDPELLRRPVIVAGGRVVIGYDENGMLRF